MEQEYAAQLAEARANGSQKQGETDSSGLEFEESEAGLSLARSRQISKKLSPAKMASSNLGAAKKIRPFADFPYFLAIGVAIFKDLIDLTGIGSLPGIGWIVTILVSLVMFMAYLMAGGLKGRQSAKKLVVLVSGSLVEIFGFGVNFVPIETIAGCVVYYLELKNRAESNKE